MPSINQSKSTTNVLFDTLAINWDLSLKSIPCFRPLFKGNVYMLLSGRKTYPIQDWSVKTTPDLRPANTYVAHIREFFHPRPPPPPPFHGLTFLIFQLFRYAERAEWATEVMKATGKPVAVCLSVSLAGAYEWSSAWKMCCAGCSRGYVWVIGAQISTIVPWVPELNSLACNGMLRVIR